MSYALVVVSGLLAGMLAKGKLSNLLNISFSKAWLFFAAFGFIATVRIISRYVSVNMTLTMAFQVIILILLTAGFWFNRNYFGIWFIAIGYFLNALVMMLNGGKMPVSIEALKKAGLMGRLNGIDIKHHIFSNADKIRLPFFADIIHPPYFLSYGMDVISIGDMVIALGVFVLTIELVLGKRTGMKNND